RAVDPGECSARVLGSELADGVRVGGCETLEHGDLEPVLVGEVAARPRVDLMRVGRDEADTARAECAQRAAHRLGGRNRRSPGCGAHAARSGLVVMVGEQARRGLDQYHHLDPGGAEQPCLIVDVIVPARRERMARRGRHEPREMRLVAGWQTRELRLDGGIGRWNENPEMMSHIAGECTASQILRLRYYVPDNASQILRPRWRVAEDALITFHLGLHLGRLT